MAFASKANTGFISYPRSLNNDTIPFDSDAPNAAACSLPLHHSSAFACMLSKHDHQAISRLRMMTFEFACNLPSPSL